MQEYESSQNCRNFISLEYENVGYTHFSKYSGVSSPTLISWFKSFRRIYSTRLNVRFVRKMVGTESEPMQIDEARFAGRRKYNKGRMSAGDSPPNESSHENVKNNHSHCRRIDGPWVFGLIKGEDLRCFYVQKRDAKTFLEIIKSEVVSGSTIHSDEWPAYRQLSKLGSNHKTVNHQIHYVNPIDGCNTPEIERLCVQSHWMNAVGDTQKGQMLIYF